MNSLPEKNESLKGSADCFSALLGSLYLDPYCDERLSMLKRFIYNDSFICDFGVAGALYLVSEEFQGLEMHFPWLLDDAHTQHIYEFDFGSLIGQKLMTHIRMGQRSCLYLDSLLFGFSQVYFYPLWKGNMCMGGIALFSEFETMGISKDWLDRFCLQAESFL